MLPGLTRPKLEFHFFSIRFLKRRSLREPLGIRCCLDCHCLFIRCTKCFSSLVKITGLGSGALRCANTETADKSTQQDGRTISQTVNAAGLAFHRYKGMTIPQPILQVSKRNQHNTLIIRARPSHKPLQKELIDEPTLSAVEKMRFAHDIRWLLLKRSKPSTSVFDQTKVGIGWSIRGTI